MMIDKAISSCYKKDQLHTQRDTYQDVNILSSRNSGVKAYTQKENVFSRNTQKVFSNHTMNVPLCMQDEPIYHKKVAKTPLKSKKK
mmetsp:Transcript_10696/g.9419  ORF Transcript_10696/g.9419 Transcript_10696/m.9419 type:complete len:86 (+) Transcript_10696:142-399(+)